MMERKGQGEGGDNFFKISPYFVEKYWSSKNLGNFILSENKI